MSHWLPNERRQKSRRSLLAALRLTASEWKFLDKAKGVEDSLNRRFGSERRSTLTWTQRLGPLTTKRI